MKYDKRGGRRAHEDNLKAPLKPQVESSICFEQEIFEELVGSTLLDVHNSCPDLNT